MGLFDVLRAHKWLDLNAPDPSTPIDDVELLAVDMETTGLKPKQHQIVSIGWVPIANNRVQLSGAKYVLIKGVEVGNSATIHHLRDSDLENGCMLEEAMEMLTKDLMGKAMLAHFAPIETAFYSHACKQLWGKEPQLQVVDTFALERRHMERMSTLPRGEDLRLSRVRSRYGLPNYRNHNALTDAMACAELYLAMAAHRPPSTLKDMQKNLQI
ncbi:MAG: exonuclease domain-containing protein [Corynebacterium sp.]|uniref:exonuclease domain-containing protein n=2 Tax=Corynebacterium casei TaxID=160386 RepID=UPI0018693D90|nr:exonuclease domain-containing protein [Corynebacterium casei]